MFLVAAVCCECGEGVFGNEWLVIDVENWEGSNFLGVDSIPNHFRIENLFFLKYFCGILFLERLKRKATKIQNFYSPGKTWRILFLSDFRAAFVDNPFSKQSGWISEMFFVFGMLKKRAKSWIFEFDNIKHVLLGCCLVFWIDNKFLDVLLLDSPLMRA